MYWMYGSAKKVDLSNFNPVGVQEWRLATADHQIIVAAVAACSKIFDLDRQEDYVRAQLRLDTLPDGTRTEFYRFSGSSDSKEPRNVTLTNFQRATIFLSDATSRARIETAVSAAENYRTMFWFQLAIVGLGAITTILISVKSISNAQTRKNQNWYFWIGIFAIIFSAVATATSALNSFYGPREAYYKSGRSLSALRQLHADIVARVASTTDTEHPENCPKFDPTKKDDENGKLVQDWTTRLGAIVGGAETGSSTPQGGATTTSPGGGGQGGGGGGTGGAGRGGGTGQ
jgi:hypothetical protein